MDYEGQMDQRTAPHTHQESLVEYDGGIPPGWSVLEDPETREWIVLNKDETRAVQIIEPTDESGEPAEGDPLFVCFQRELDWDGQNFVKRKELSFRASITHTTAWCAEQWLAML